MFKNYGDSVCLVEQESGQSYTYTEVFDAAEKIAHAIDKRCLVFSLCLNCAASVAAYVGCINHQIVPLLISEKIDKELLDELIDKYHPQFMWMPEERYQDDFANQEIILSVWGYHLVKMNLLPFEIAEDLGLLLTTSGSTGSPKLVRQSYKNIKSNTESIIEYLKIDSTERAITTLPMNYTYGLSILNTHLYSGATMLLTEKTIMQKEFWDFFKNEKATSFGGVPYIYEMLNKLRFFRMDLSSLRYMTQAGGKLSPELHKKFAEYAIESGKKFIVMYGQTEATARMAYLPADKSLEKYGSMGVAIPGGRFELIDVNDQIITEPEVSGELVYYGDNVTLGYAECGADLSKPDERCGRLSTGDMAKRDADGFYFIVGRKKRFLKIFGNRVNLDECEMLLKGNFQNVSCACGGVDDKLYIFVDRKDSAQESELKAYLADKTKLNPSAFRTVLVDEIPKNDSGKVLYVELQKLI